MDNLTHSLVGAALAQAALPAGAARPQRRLFLAAGVLAANLPDADLLYVGITPPPLGYLLHHRGHTHTVVGLLAQGLLLLLLSRVLPYTRRLGAVGRSRVRWLIAGALCTHILLDAGNSYGVHPFHPFDSRWYYGDAVFIFEPWLWLLFGLPVAWNASGRFARITLLALLAGVPILLAVPGVVPRPAVAALAVAGILIAWWIRLLSVRTRALAGLAAGALFIAFLAGLGALARATTRALVEPHVRGELVDIVLSPNPADPFCWTVIAIEKDERAGTFAHHPGTLSLAPRWRPPTACASHRFAGRNATRVAGGRLAWNEEVRQSLEALRALREEDCWVKAWLQFGRAPALRDGEILDLRFDNGPRDNFTAMPVDPGRARCPAHVTAWAPPRADLWEPSRRP
jgi:inner membrane protein